MFGSQPCHSHVQGGQLALILWAPSTTRNGPFWCPVGPFFMVVDAFSGSKKHGVLKIRKSYKTPNGSTNNACCLKHVFSLSKERCTSQNAAFVQNGPPSLLDCDFYHLRDAHFGIFGKPKWAPGPIRESGGAILGKAGVVCVCGAVCVCGGCHGVSNDC